MGRKLLYTFLYTSVLLICISCNKTDDFSIDQKYGYFPLELNSWVVYDVSFIEFDITVNSYDTSIYQLKEFVHSTYIDEEGIKTYRIERYQRADETQPWNIENVWSANLQTSSAERVEDNLRFIKLVFPIVEGKKWEGNKFVYGGNNGPFDLTYMKDWEYEYTNVDSAYSINGFLFDSTTTVTQIDSDIGIEKTYFIEKYAKNLGMVYKESVHLLKDNVTDPWSYARKGFIYTMELIDHSKN